MSNENNRDKSLSVHKDEDIDSIFNKINEAKSVAFICHDTPDPDTIAPAFALNEYCFQNNINSKIFYGGNISHFQNKAMVNVLGINMVNFNSIIDGESKENKVESATKYIQEHFDLVIFLDTSCYHGEGNVRYINLVPDIIIDHHAYDIDLNGESDNILMLNHRCGATCSILSYMIEKKNIQISKESATALFIGLMSDTNNMTSNNVEEIDQIANRYLLSHVDFAIYTRIMYYELPSQLIKIRKIAYSDDFYYRQDNLAIVGVSYLKPEFKDLASVIADEVIRIEGIQKVVVIGIIEEQDSSKAITSSVRTSADTMNTDLFCKQIFGKKYSGGKQGAGGAYLPISSLVGDISECNRDSFFQMVYEHFRKIILEVHTRA